MVDVERGAAKPQISSEVAPTRGQVLQRHERDFKASKH